MDEDIVTPDSRHEVADGVIALPPDATIYDRVEMGVGVTREEVEPGVWILEEE